MVVHGALLDALPRTRHCNMDASASAVRSMSAFMNTISGMSNWIQAPYRVAFPSTLMVIPVESCIGKPRANSSPEHHAES